MSAEREADEAARLDAVSVRIGWRFRDPLLLREALTHASAAGEGRAVQTYERLEFLGDRVLGLIMAQAVFAQHPDEAEGKLAARYNALVDRDACARAARRAGLGDAVIAARGRREAPAPLAETILSDVCESVIGALYLEGGLEAAEAFIKLYWADAFEAGARPPASPKNVLQEWAAARKRSEPRYEIVSREGPDHAPRFVVEASVEGLEPVRAEGSSKRDAERAAAQALLRQAGLDV
jgi:ribonuclease-3